MTESWENMGAKIRRENPKFEEAAVKMENKKPAQGERAEKTAEFSGARSSRRAKTGSAGRGARARDEGKRIKVGAGHQGGRGSTRRKKAAQPAGKREVGGRRVGPRPPQSKRVAAGIALAGRAGKTFPKKPAACPSNPQNLMANEPPTSRAQPHENTGFLERTFAEQQAPLVRYAARLLGDPDRARDVVQDAFVKLMAQPRETVDGHVVEWLFTVCRNGALDVLRKEKRMRHFEEGELERAPAVADRPGRTLEAAEMAASVLRLIDRLPPNQQEVVRLKFQNGFSYKEIAGITALSVTNVGFLIHTAVTRLRREFATERL
jgi:RNA polymerase sigma factor (sigma-70 family)